MLLYGVFGLLVLLIVAWMGLAWFVRYRVEKFEGPEQLKLAEQWANTPLSISWELVLPSETENTTVSEGMLSFPPELPPEADATRREFFRLLDEQYLSYRTTLAETLYPIRQKMEAAAPLSPDDITNITTISAEIKPLIPLARALASTPAYAHEHPESWDLHHTYRFDRGLSVLRFYALSQLYLKNQDEAIDTMDATIDLLTWRGHTTRYYECFMMVRAVSRYASHFSLALDVRTSDSTALARQLDVLNRHRDSLHQFPDVSIACHLEYLQLFRDAKACSYLPDNEQTQSPTPLALMELHLRSDQFHNWVINNLEPNSEQYKRSARVIAYKGRHLLSAPPFERFTNSIPTVFHPAIIIATRPLHTFLLWSSEQSLIESRQGTLVTYDLTRLHLARRIAELRGESLPVTEQDFVPKYMPEFPTDPHTGKPYEFSNSEQMFFSAGYDGIPGNENDEKLELPLGIYVPPKSLTPEEEAEAARLFEDMSGGMLLPVSE